MTKTKRVYSKKDFNSGDGMLTSVWGPSMWHYLHIMSFNYPVNPTSEDKKHYRDFVLNLKNVLPCKYCRMNLKTNFKQMPLTPKIFKYKKLKTMKNQNHGKGCTEPLYGEKAKCIIKIVPQTDVGETFQMDEKCIKKREK